MEFRPLKASDQALAFAASDDWSRAFWSNQVWALQQLGVATTWASTEGNQVLAWFSMQPFSLVLEGAEEATSMALAPKPVIGLRGLAVASTHQRQGLGRQTLLKALSVALCELDTKGGIGVLAEAPTSQARPWLERSRVFKVLSEKRGWYFVSYASLQSWRQRGWIE